MKNLIIFLIIVSSVFVSTANAQESTYSVKSQVAKVIFFGLGGAVLGLSTLSFYGEPEEHLSNISTGLALGIIAGATYITYETMEESAAINNKNQMFSRYQEFQFQDPADTQKNLRAQKKYQPTLVAYGWSF